MCDATAGDQTLPALTILLAAPRGFCAGVDRAIQIVELALARHGAPVYVRHEIVHNRYVVETLRAKGAIFVEDLDEIPDNQRPVVFSAHGVPKSVRALAASRKLFSIDATCPLVTKVHLETRRHSAAGREVLLIGHAGHPEIVGTMGQLPPHAVHLIETIDDAQAIRPKDPEKLAYTTQTTLSVDETKSIIGVLKTRFPRIVGPRTDDICYATSNRQNAVKRIAPRCEFLIVIGAPSSSNSLRLVEVAKRAGCPHTILVERARDIPWPSLSGISTVGLTAGASAPEILIEEIIGAFKARFDTRVETVTTATESLIFKLPRELQEQAKL
jgi:4-hydroxy-3-methylbut-2-en-1-yl diphosphate reductase